MKIRNLFLIAVFAVTAVSCVEEPFVETNGNELRVIGSLVPETRTTYVEGDGVIETHWVKDDAIGLMTDKQYNLNYIASSSGKSTEFNKGNGSVLNNEEGKTVYAYYPYSYSQKLDDSYTIQIASNCYLSGSTLKPFLYGKGTIHDNQLNLSFKHFYSYIRIKISKDAIVERLEEYISKSAYAGKIEDYDLSKTYLHLWSDQDISVSFGGYINPQNGETKFNNENGIGKDIQLILDDIDYDSDGTYIYMVPVLAQNAGATLRLQINYKRKQEGLPSEMGVEFSKTAPESGLLAGHVYSWEINGEDSGEEDADAQYSELLTKLYDQTNGPNWYKKNNWLSDSPVSDWEGVYLSTAGALSSVWLQSNNLVGEYPEILKDFFDMGVNLSLNHNQLYGQIPDVVKKHTMWQYYGWNMVAQWPYGEPVIQDYNLFLTKGLQCVNLLNGETVDIDAIVNANKLTQVIKGYDNNVDFSYILNEICSDRINSHLDHKDNGLKTLIFVGEGTDAEYDSLKESIISKYRTIDGVYWLKGNSPISGHSYSGSYFFKNTGELVYYADYLHLGTTSGVVQTQIKNLNEQSHTNCDEVLKSLLGEPNEHPEFILGIYNSTDYSKDGTKKLLQEATKGKKGVNLVLMGDAFVDKDIESGYYEECMKAAMEKLFSKQPYKALRNRFNVYTVYVVSPNAEYTDGAVYAFHNKGSYVDAKEYAVNAGIYESGQPLMVTVIHNPKFPIVSSRSQCFSFVDDGSFVSFIRNADTEGYTILHETGGHGIGMLFDEYVETGLGAIDDETKALWDDEWNKYGRGANVDWRSDPSKVKWASFLEDENYADEGLGVFEGAYYSTGAYRASENSLMNNYAVPEFNAPSREAIYKRVMQLSEGEDWEYNYEDFVVFDKNSRNDVNASEARVLTEEERRIYIQNHQPPVYLKRNSFEN